MYSPYNKRFSFIDSPSSIWYDLVFGIVGLGFGALCIFGAIALLMRIL